MCRWFESSRRHQIMHRWRRSYALACKANDTGANPVRCSKICVCGGTGRPSWLKTSRPKGHLSSSLSRHTIVWRYGGIGRPTCLRSKRAKAHLSSSLSSATIYNDTCNPSSSAPSCSWYSELYSPRLCYLFTGEVQRMTVLAVSPFMVMCW